ncbi:MAG: cellulase family glycosylhydrolase [Crocinitomicaceae bacterium]|nr:cellulase family glycosylhydrolase [Crocinitomicaceae bacterium]
MKKNYSPLKVITILCFTLFSLSVNAQGVVSSNGALSVSGTHIVNESGNIVSFAGNSMFWSNSTWGAEPFYNANVVNWLKNDWGSTIVRAAMGVGPENGGYLVDQTGNENRVKTIVDAAIAEDIYVIIDWHSHDAHNQQSEAIAFFTNMANLYGSYDNVIYEIYNEPTSCSWSNDVKPYAEAVIAAIRAVDPDNLIIVGSPTWSQDVDVASLDPITSSTNIAYTIHFYAGTHGTWERSKAQTAIDNGLALFCTEWGTVNANGDGAVDAVSTEQWMEFFCENSISHVNWHIHDKPEGSAAVIPGASPNGNWTSNDLTASGTLVKSLISGWPARNCEGDASVSDNDAISLNVYPNPFENTIHIEGEGYFEITVFDAMGKQILVDYGMNSISLNTNDLAQGSYILQLNSLQGVKRTKIAKL